MLEGYAGRLFWKLLLALWASMLLSIVVAVAYLRSVELAAAPASMALTPPPSVPLLPLLPLAPVITGMVAMFAAGVGVAWYLAVPLRQLRRGLAQVAEGRFDVRVRPALGRRRDELAELADDFDRMAAQLQQLARSRQELLHDISHEMRSPLARMQAAIGLLRQDATQAAAMIDRIERESERMDALVEELLTLHRLEAAPESWAEGTVDVLDLLHAVAEDAGFEARAAGRELRIDAPGEFVARVRGELLHRAFENVVRNAVKYTAAGTAVEIQARVDGGELVVTVADRGPGVPEHARTLMFQPFTRLEGASSVRGIGLGLAIAQRALQLNGGSIEAGARPGGGLVMTLRLRAT